MVVIDVADGELKTLVEGVDGEEEEDNIDFLMGVVMGAKEVDEFPVERLPGEGGSLILKRMGEEALLDADSTGGFVATSLGRAIDGGGGSFTLGVMKVEVKRKA